jgi:hypothetical protein
MICLSHGFLTTLFKHSRLCSNESDRRIVMSGLATNWEGGGRGLFKVTFQAFVLRY